MFSYPLILNSALWLAFLGEMSAVTVHSRIQKKKKSIQVSAIALALLPAVSSTRPACWGLKNTWTSHSSWVIPAEAIFHQPTPSWTCEWASFHQRAASLLRLTTGARALPAKIICVWDKEMCIVLCLCGSDFQPFSSHGTRKLITKVLWHTKTYVFYCPSEKKIGIILIHSHQMAIVVLAVVIFWFDNLREKRSVPLTKQSGIACFQILVAHGLKTAALRCPDCLLSNTIVTINNCYTYMCINTLYTHT